MGLIYIHNHGMIHGELKGVRLQLRYLGLWFHLADLNAHQGQYPD